MFYSAEEGNRSQILNRLPIQRQDVAIVVGTLFRAGDNTKPETSPFDKSPR